MTDRWAAASSYEAYMGRWSRQLAPVFLSWLGIRTRAHWLDVGCGTGALTHAICTHSDPASVTGCDPSSSFIEAARKQITDERVTFVVADAGHLPPRPGGYDGITSLLALNFFHDATAALATMRALAAPDGVISACVWDYAGGMEFLRRFWDAVVTLDPAARALDEAARFPICHPDRLVALFDGAGLREVVCEPIEICTHFVDFEDYWQPFLAATGPAPSYVASLNDSRRTALRKLLEEMVVPATNGSISLAGQAWAVRGERDSTSHPYPSDLRI